MWDLCTGQQHANLTGHTQPVRAVACTRLDDDIPIAITGGGPGASIGAGEVIVWDLRTGQQHANLAGHTQPVRAVACTHLDDDTPIAITGAAGEVIAWNLHTGQQHANLAGHSQPVNALACTRLDDGTALAITGGGVGFGAAGEVIVWDLRTRQQHANLAGHTQPVRAVACTRLDDGTPIAITGGGASNGAGEVIVWDLRTRRMQQTLAVPYSVSALCFAPNLEVAIGTATEVVVLQLEFSMNSPRPALRPSHP
jgi:WD40 repeat protein